MNKNITISKETLGNFCRQYHIKKLAIFGSALHDNFSEDSDLDILVEFESGHIPGFAFFDIQDKLSKLYGRSVDLNTPNFLSRYLSDQVITEAKLQYVSNGRQYKPSL